MTALLLLRGYQCSLKVIACVTFWKKTMQKMKQEHSQLSREAHECADSIPDLNKMVFAVQSLG